MKISESNLPARMRRYLNAQLVCCKSSTVGTYITALRHFHSFLTQTFGPNNISSRCIASITPDILNQYLQALHRKQLAPYSRVNYFLAVKKYLAWEVEQKILQPDVIQNFNRSALPKVPEYLPRPLSHETDCIFFDLLRNSQDPFAKAFLLLRLTGLRISELINLSTDCVLTTPKNEQYLKVPLGKMNNERLVPLNSEALHIIEKLKNNPNNQTAHHNRLIGVKEPLPRTYQRLRSHFNKLLGNLSDQNKPITFHRLRHTYATTLLSAGVSIVSIMKLLGHRRIEMSLRYAMVTPTHLRNEYLKAMATLERLWTPPVQHQPLPNTHRINPAEFLDLLASFLKKETTTGLSNQKNLLKRLSRLKSDLQKMPIPRFPAISLG